VIEELDELASAETEAEKGWMKRAICCSLRSSVARSHGVAPEDALRHANAKFEGRFRAMEALAR